MLLMDGCGCLLVTGQTLAQAAHGANWFVGSEDRDAPVPNLVCLLLRS